MELVPARENLLLVGASGGGKSTLVTGLLERLIAQKFQCCIIDPEGDYQDLEGCIEVGTPQQAPRTDAVADVLRKTGTCAAVNLLGVTLPDRPGFFARLLGKLAALRSGFGRPHFIVVDEAHHLLPAEGQSGAAHFARDAKGMMFVTVRPESVSPIVLDLADRIVAVGNEAGGALRTFCAHRGLPAPDVPDALPVGELVTLSVADPVARLMAAIPSQGTRRRHLRKYAEGKLEDDRAFYFRGPEGRLNLRAANLMTFLDLADGVDGETFEFHRRNGDFSAWIRQAIKDRELADEVASVERSDEPADAARAAIRKAVEAGYTLPA